ncbi:MAG: NADH-quinone oxidoreductase subunit J [Thiovulaceae bacterium]|nr:NADH-quinone oxidoreductase subunit J [Sulfurimonadaceae bacterium]
MFESFAFYFFSIVVIGSFIVTVMANNPLYSLTSLATGMIMISGFFFLLNADFLGVVQIIVYTGAVMALYAFGMMFFDSTKDVKEKNPSASLVFLLSGLSALLVVVIFAAPMISPLDIQMTVGEGLAGNIQALYPMDTEVINQAAVLTGAEPITQVINNVQSVGMVLFTKYLIPFEVAAVMLLVAMIAGIILAGKKMDKSLTLTSEDEIQEKGIA